MVSTGADAMELDRVAGVCQCLSAGSAVQTDGATRARPPNTAGARWYLGEVLLAILPGPVARPGGQYLGRDRARADGAKPVTMGLAAGLGASYPAATSFDAVAPVKDRM
jgi:hypothetical protein